MEEILEQIKVYAGKAKDSAVKLTHKVIGKTNNVVDQTKVKFAISDTQSKMEDIFTKIGGAIYKSHTEGNEAPDLTEVFAKLDELKNELDDLKGQLCRLKDTKQCPYCNTFNDKKNEYCAKCGKKLDGIETEEPVTETEETKAEEEDVFTVEISDVEDDAE